MAAIAATPATPPTTPPAIAPTLVKEETLELFGAAFEVDEDEGDEDEGDDELATDLPEKVLVKHFYCISSVCDKLTDRYRWQGDETSISRGCYLRAPNQNSVLNTKSRLSLITAEGTIPVE